MGALQVTLFAMCSTASCRRYDRPKGVLNCRFRLLHAW